jgi:hypothetical protein
MDDRRGGFAERGGFGGGSERGEEGKGNHIIKTKSRGGLGSAGAPE